MNGFGTKMPALLMSTSIVPKRCCTLSMRLRAVEGSPTSPSTSSKFSDAVKVPARVIVREFAITLKPASRNPCVKPRPIPLDAPVIKAVCLWLVSMAIQMEGAGVGCGVPAPGTKNRVTIR